MSGPTLTRGEALDLIDECKGFRSRLAALSLEWIGHENEDCDPVELEDLLRDYVAEACLTDSVREHGPGDQDDTGIPS